MYVVSGVVLLLNIYCVVDVPWPIVSYVMSRFIDLALT